MSLRTLRLNKGWSQEELALVSDLSSRTIQRLERGERASLEAVKALAASFELSPEHMRSHLEQHGAETMPQDSHPTPPQAIWKSLLRGFLYHLAAAAIGIAIVALVANALGVTWRLLAGVSMLWTAVIFIQLAWLLAQRDRLRAEEMR